MSDHGPFIGEPTCIGHCLHRALVIFSKRLFLGVRDVVGKGKGLRSDFRWLTYGNILQKASQLARGLVWIGVHRRSFIGICASNCPEWIIADFACALDDFVSVGLHTSWPQSDINRVIEDADITCVIVSAEMVPQFIKAAHQQKSKKLKYLVVIDNGKNIEFPEDPPSHLTVVQFSELLNEQYGPSITMHTGVIGSTMGACLDPAKIMAINEDDIFTLIYSSGTSGQPKGIPVSKRRWKIDARSSAIAVTPRKRAVSYMALAHGADRGVVWQTAFCGGSVGFARTDSHTNFVQDLISIKPDFFLGLSHTWNRFYFNFQKQLKMETLPSIKEKMKAKAKSMDIDVNELISEFLPSLTWEILINSFCCTLEGEFIRKKVIRQFRRNLGGGFQTAATGGAHTSHTVIQFIQNVCMIPGNESRVFNSYGATEFPGISSNGAISDSVELKLRDLLHMGYSSQDRTLHPELINILKGVFDKCKKVKIKLYEYVKLDELKTAIMKTLPDLIDEKREQLPRRSHFRNRFHEVNEKMRANNFDNLDLVLSRATEVNDSYSNIVEYNTFLAEFTKEYGELTSRGEILVRTKDGSHTQSYWKNPDKTANAWINNGWYCTGDVGMLDYNSKHDKQKDPDSGFFQSQCKDKSMILSIIDRCKGMVELYRHGRSVWVPIQQLEQEIYQCIPCVNQLCLVADRNQSTMVAIVVPTSYFIVQWCSKQEHKNTLSHAECCTDPDFEMAVLSELQMAGVESGCKDYEIPKHVILEHDTWTINNGCLSAVGKPRRGYLQSELYIDKLDAIYAADEVKEDMLVITSSTNITSLPGDEINDKVKEIHFSVETSKRLQKKQLIISLAKDFEYIHMQEEKIRMKSDIGFPYREKPKYMQFKYKLLDNLEAQKIINTELEKLKSVGREIHKCWKPWKHKKKKAVNAAKKTWEKILQEGEIAVEGEMKEFLSWSQSETHSFGMGLKKTDVKLEFDETNMPTKKSVDDLINASHIATEIEISKVFTSKTSISAVSQLKRIINVMRMEKFASIKAYAVLETASLPDENEEEVMLQWGEQCDALVTACARFKTYCPRQLIYQFDWCWPANEISKAPAPAIPMGDAKVWCFASGRLIEQDIKQIGTPRYHVLDAPTTTDISIKYQHWFDQIQETLLSRIGMKGRFSARAQDAENAMVLLTEFNPWVNAPLSRDIAHWTHLRHMVKKQVHHSEDIQDTPIAIITQACRAYSDRLALGMPIEFESPLPNAANIILDQYDDYAWLRYRHVLILVERVAKHLMNYELTKVFIGISGYNNFGFAVADLAVARVSSCSVGLHMTYTQTEVQKVLDNCMPIALLVTKDLLRKRTGDLWCIQNLPYNTTVKYVIVMDLNQVECNIEEKYINAEKNNGRGVLFCLLSLLEFVSPKTDKMSINLLDPYKCKGVKIPHPADNRIDEYLFTLMYTSGSSGTPKGVMVGTRTFQADMGEPTSASPLVTVSYIPLSHSSDRVKLWEFLFNGGRIGFAYYDASNWHAHEHSKKESMLNSMDGENNVRELFSQICRLQPSAMSCPPRIWNGLYFIFMQKLEQLKNGPVSQGVMNVTDAETIALNIIRAMFGKRISFLATGGASTRPDVLNFARKLFPKATFVDSYGTTECGAITSNGIPIWSKNIEVKLIPIVNYGSNTSKNVGEIWVKSPHTHLGYFKQPEKTALIWKRDGWCGTGDLGRIDKFGKLHIIERLSAVRFLTDQTMVIPTKLETTLEQSSLVLQSLIDIDPSNQMIAAILVLDSSRFKMYCQTQKLSQQEAFRNQILMKKILSDAHTVGGSAISEMLDHLKVLLFTDDPWTVKNGLLTGTQKKRTKLIQRKFASHLSRSWKNISTQSSPITITTMTTLNTTMATMTVTTTTTTTHITTTATRTTNVMDAKTRTGESISSTRQYKDTLQCLGIGLGVIACAIGTVYIYSNQKSEKKKKINK